MTKEGNTNFIAKPAGATSSNDESGFVVPPAGASSVLPQDASSQMNTMGRTGTQAYRPSGALPPKPINTAQQEPPLATGTKVRIQRRTQVFDPYSREYFSVYPHTQAVVINPRDRRLLHRGYVTIMLRSNDNGNGRVVQIAQTELIEATA